MLLLLVWSVLRQVRSQDFYLVDKKGEFADEGLLIANRVGSHKTGAVCDDEFSDASATAICRSMEYDKALEIWADKTWISGRDFGRSWKIQRDYVIVLDDVRCPNLTDVQFSDCSYVIDHDCGEDEQLFLNCGCSDARYLLPDTDGCAPCPDGVPASAQDAYACTCRPGSHWDGSCTLCPENTYKAAADDGDCTVCPAETQSDPGATYCRCQAGFYWSTDSCERCSKGSVSSSGSNNCVRCPRGSSPLSGSAACTCAAGKYWNGSSCLHCPANQYSTPNSTRCTSCPVGTVSEPGAAHCAPCPAGEYWRAHTCHTCTGATDHTSCDRCPAGFSVSGVVCVDERTLEIKGAVDWTVVGLAILLVVSLIVVLLLVIRLIRNNKLTKVPDSIPYNAVRESWVDETEQPGYAEPDYSARQRGDSNAAIYAEPNSTHHVAQDEVGYVPQYAAPDNEMYIESDRLQYCGIEEEAYHASTDNIYDNI